MGSGVYAPAGIGARLLIKLVPVSGCPASDGASALDLSASGPAGDEATAAARPGPARASVADTTTTNDPSIRRAGLTRDFVLWSVRVVAPAPITKLHSPSCSQRSLCNDCNFNRRPTEDVENTTSFYLHGAIIIIIIIIIIILNPRKTIVGKKVKKEWRGQCSERSSNSKLLCNKTELERNNKKKQKCVETKT